MRAIRDHPFLCPPVMLPFGRMDLLGYYPLRIIPIPDGDLPGAA